MTDSTPTSHKHYVGGVGWPESTRPDTVELDEPPHDPLYADSIGEPRKWAMAVAENVMWLARQPHALHTIDECWISVDLAICLRYNNSGGRFGGRFAHLDQSLIMRPNPAGSAGQQASNLYSVRLADGAPDRVNWTEPDGRQWWGDAPATGWPSVLDSGTRLVTVPTSRR